MSLLGPLFINLFTHILRKNLNRNYRMFCAVGLKQCKFMKHMVWYSWSCNLEFLDIFHHKKNFTWKKLNSVLLLIEVIIYRQPRNFNFTCQRLNKKHFNLRWNTILTINDRFTTQHKSLMQWKKHLRQE